MFCHFPLVASTVTMQVILVLFAQVLRYLSLGLNASPGESSASVFFLTKTLEI